MPNGSLLKQNPLTGVINVMSDLNVLASEICQNLLFASSLVNFFAPVDCVRVLSTLESGWCSLRTFWFKCVKSI